MRPVRLPRLLALRLGALIALLAGLLAPGSPAGGTRAGQRARRRDHPLRQRRQRHR